MSVNYVGRSIYLGRNSTYSLEVLQECQKCGSLVRHNMTEQHSAFHEDVQELKDKVFRAGLE